MKIVIRNSLQDLLSFGRHLKVRETLFKGASSRTRREGEVNRHARHIHPDSQNLVIFRVVDESTDMRSYYLKPADSEQSIAPFRAGQYLVISFELEGLILNRPYSISSSPAESIKDNSYRITLKRKSSEKNGYFSHHAYKHWELGSSLKASGPQGHFYYNPIRDASLLLCIAGGSGITPFRSLVPDLLNGEEDLTLVLFYGFNSGGDAVFSDDFRALEEAYRGRFQYHPLAMDREGVISAERIRESLGRAGEDSNRRDFSCFICGPPALQLHMDRVLSSFSLRPKFIRRESYAAAPSSDKAVKECRLVLRQDSGDIELKASTGESLLTTLERSGVDAPSSCRSGECGWCRAQLLSGEISADQGLTAVRQADSKFGWIHPCISYPEGDVIIRVSENRNTVVK